MTDDERRETTAISATDSDFAPGGVDDVLSLVARVDVDVFVLRWTVGDSRERLFAFDVARIPSSAALDTDRTVDVRCVTDDPPVAQPVPVAAIESVRPVSSAADATDLLPDDPVRRAAVLCGLAAHAPELVDVSVVLCLLGSADEGAVVDALQCLSQVATERPDAAVATIPRVHALVDDPPSDAVRAAALTCLAGFAAALPEEVAPHVETVFPALDAADDTLVVGAVTCVSHVASVDPDAVADATDALLGALSASDPEVRMHAAYTLGRIAAVSPERLRSDAASLSRIVGDETERTATRLNATCAVGRVAGTWPDAVVDSLETFVDALGDEDAGVRANAAGVVGDIATTHAVTVKRHVSPLVACLEDDDGVTRANGSTALARVAREFPEAVCGHVDRFVDALEDDNPLVRENVCWTLGYLPEEAHTARQVLERVRTDDGDERVRGRAAWALDEVGRSEPNDGIGATD